MSDPSFASKFFVGLSAVSLFVIALMLVLFYHYGPGPHKAGFDDSIYHASRVGGNRQRFYGGIRSDTGGDTLPISGNACPTKHERGFGYDARLEELGYSNDTAANVADIAADGGDPGAPMYGFAAAGKDGYANPYSRKSNAVSDQKLNDSLHGLA